MAKTIRDPSGEPEQINPINPILHVVSLHNPTSYLSYALTGLGAPSLHQTLPPGYPPTLPGSIPQAYQFARDPQTGQLVVIPTEHISHYSMFYI